MEQINASWIQAGELGFAFVVVVLCAFLIRYVIQSTQKLLDNGIKRENQLMGMIMEFQPLLQNVADQLGHFHPVLSEILRQIGDVDNRLAAIENGSNKKPVQRNGNGGQRKRQANGNGNDREYKPE